MSRISSTMPFRRGQVLQARCRCARNVPASSPRTAPSPTPALALKSEHDRYGRRSHAAVETSAWFLVVCLTLSKGLGQDVERAISSPPFSMNGAVTTTLSGYTVSGIERRNQPFSWSLQGSATATAFDIQIPFGFIISERNRSFQQPYNEFGLSPTYRWLTVHGGYRSMTLSKYTLAGAKFLGAGCEVSTDFMEMKAMYGQFQRAVEDDSTNRYVIPAYRRTGWAVKVLVGSRETNAYLSLFRARDDEFSLSRVPGNGTLPMENAVLAGGATLRFGTLLALEVEMSGSFLTRNLFSDVLTGEGFSSHAQAERIRFLRNWFDVRTSSSLAGAASAKLGFRLPSVWVADDVGLNVGLEIVEPDFTSLGAYYFDTDVGNLTVGSDFRLLEGTLRMAGSVGVQQDNIAKTKLATTTRWISSVNAQWAPGSAYGVDVRYSNYSTGQEAHRAPVNDSIRLRNVNNTLSLSPRYSIASPSIHHMFSGLFSYQVYDDLNAITNVFTGTKTVISSLNYNATFTRQRLSTGASVLYTATETSVMSFHSLGVNLSAGANFLDNALTVNLSVGASRVTAGAESPSAVLNSSLSVVYAASPYDRFTASVTGINNTSTTLSMPAFAEYSSHLTYSRSFSWTPGATPTSPYPEGK